MTAIGASSRAKSVRAALLFLLLGLALAYFVAVACALQPSAWLEGQSEPLVRATWVRDLVPADWPGLNELSRVRGHGFERRSAAAALAKVGPNTVAPYAYSYYVVERRSGWPWRCTTGSHGSKTEFMDPQATQAVHSGFGRGELRVAGDRVIPVRPILAGLIGNALVWGLAAVLALRGPGAVRRTWRRARGRCAGCGYVLAGTERCPECGAVRVRARNDATRIRANARRAGGERADRITRGSTAPTR